MFRRERPPAGLLALLERDERVVSWALADLGTVAATTHGLWLPSGDSFRRIGWELVDKAVWRDGVLTVIEARDLPPAVRRRVEASVVRSEVLPVDGGAARFVARRVPRCDGVTWRARLEPGTLDAPQTRASVRARLDGLAANWAVDVS